MRWREIIVGNIDEQWTSNVILMDHKMTRFELLGFKELFIVRTLRVIDRGNKNWTTCFFSKQFIKFHWSKF